MANYLFIGQAPRYYPDFSNLVAMPGAVVTCNEPPDDGCWLKTDAPVTKPGSCYWPVTDYQPPAPVVNESSQKPAKASKAS